MPQHAHWSARVRKAWLHRNWLTCLLWPISQIYAVAMAIRNHAYRAGWAPVHRARVPVIVVGNIVAGGAGKTPVVIGVVQHLLNTGHKPGVVSRGYGRQPDTGADELPLAVHARSRTADTGDEPKLIHQATGVPVVVASQRWQAVEHLLATHPDTTVIVCDDGLQHLALHADVSIAVFDERGLGNGWLLPAGMLREPWPKGTGRHIDLVVQAVPAGHQRSNRVSPIRDGERVHIGTKKLAAYARNAAGEQVGLHALATKPALAIAGIAKPELFFDMLRKQGVDLDETWSLPDHFSPDNELRSKLANTLLRKSVFLTEKDAVKLYPLEPASSGDSDARREHSAVATGDRGWQHQLWAVPLELDIEPAFFQQLDAKLSSPHGQQTA